MLTKRPRCRGGFTLVELLVTIAIATMLLAVGAPMLFQFVQNARIRTNTESLLTGIQRAKSEAISRNGRVRFQLVSTLDDTCVLTDNSALWVVNADPAGVADAVQSHCGDAASDTVAPRIIARRDGSGLPQGLTVDAGGTTSLVFNGLGQVVEMTPGPLATVSIDVSNPVAGECAAAGGDLTCLRIVVTPAGLMRMCNPKLAYATHPQGC